MTEIKGGEIPAAVKEKIEAEFDEAIKQNIAYLHPQQRSFFRRYCLDMGEFGFGLATVEYNKAMEQIVRLHKQLQDSLLLYQNQVETIAASQKEIEELKKEIQRLNNLLNRYMPYNMND